MKKADTTLELSQQPITVGDLERVLFDAFPAEDAESWDKVGLSVGNRNEQVQGVAFALDVTAKTIKQAKAAGANVLVCHHPIFLDAPFPVMPEEGGGMNPATSLYEAVRSGMNVISMHTNLDRSLAATKVLPQELGLSFISQFEERAGLSANCTDGGGRLGALCTSAPDEQLTVKELALRAKAAFGRSPRVWGDPEKRVNAIMCTTGSLGSLGKDALMRGVDVVVCGETGYHTALDLSLSGLAVILLGHDVSERPIVPCLKQALLDAGLPKELVVTIEEDVRWMSV